MLAHRGYELLDELECRELLAFNNVGRIGVSIGALPAIFPVNYLLDGDAIVFRTATGTQLAEATGKGVVAFETGYIDPTGRGGWSVLAVGIPVEITDPGTRRRLGADHPGSWRFADTDRLFRLPIEVISGTRLYSGNDDGHRHAA